MLGARGVSFPRLAAFAYWLYLLGAVTLFAALSNGDADAYAPFTSPTHNGDLWLLALLMLSFASALGAAVVVATIRGPRAEGMSWERMPIFARALDVYSWLLMGAVAVLDVTLVLLLLDRRAHTHIFDGRSGLRHDLLWSFGYPELVLLVLPAAAIAFEVFRVMPRARTPVLFVLDGLATPVLVVLGGVVIAASGGNAPVGWDFVRTILDEALLVGSFLILLGGLHYWWPKLFGRSLGDGLGQLSQAFLFAGLNVAFFPTYLHTTMTVYAYPHHAGWGTQQILSAIGLALAALGTVIFLVNVVHTHALKLGTRAGNDPWRGDTLEWFTTSPPPPHNFDRLPPVTSTRPLRDLRRRLEDQRAL
jgi:heme/copper-type cytochrome/quinol oxidase subunit 1